MHTAALFQSQGHFNGHNAKPAAFSAGSVIGHTQFIGAGEDQSFSRVSMNVRAEEALSKSLSDLTAPTSTCLLMSGLQEEDILSLKTGGL